MKEFIPKIGMIAFLVLSFLSASAYDFEVDGLGFTIVSTDNHTVSVSENKLSGEVYVPEKVEYKGVTYTVSTIENEAFSEYLNFSTTGVTRVYLPNTITAIGDKAFYLCSKLGEINLPESVSSIGESAFAGCGISSISIPTSIKTVGKYAFTNCDNLKTVYYNAIDANFSSEIFSSSANIAEVFIGNEVSVIPDWFISGLKNITNIEIPNSVKRIGTMAFSGTNIDAIIIPPSVQQLGIQPFGNIKTIIIFAENLNVERASLGLGLHRSTLISFTSNPIYHAFGSVAKAYVLKSAFALIENTQMSVIDNFNSDYNKAYDGRGITIPAWIDILKSVGVRVSPFVLGNNINAGKYTGSYEMEFAYSDYSIRIPISYDYNIVKAMLTGYVVNSSRIYGDENPDFKCVLDGFLSGENESVIQRYLINTTANVHSPCGEYKVSADIVSENYVAKISDGVITINKAPLVVGVQNASKIYGDENPNLTCVYKGFKVNDSEETAFSELPTIPTEIDITSGVGTYSLIPSGGVANNYEITEYRPGTLTINKAPLTLTASNAQRTYYEENPQFLFSLTGLRNDDDTSCITTQPTYQCSADVSSDCGEYAIIPSNADAKNYEILYENGTLTVTPAPLTLKAQNVTREYGDENPVFTFEADGLKGDDIAETALQTLPTITSTASSASNAGEYSISITGGSSKNYTFSYRSGLMTITKAPLSVSANDAERIYGDSNPTFSRSYLGFKLSDSESTAFSVLPRIECTATKTSDVGEYPIMVSGGISKNYEIASYENAVLSIKPAIATITATDKNRLYFEDNPIFDFTISGLRNSDTKACVTTAPQYNCFASKTSNAGNYEIMPYGAIAQNYVFEYKAGSLIVNKRDLTASIDNYSRVYGTDNPAFVISYTGFVNNDDASELNQTVVATCEATKLSDVGTYPIILSGGQANNYNISSYNSGNLTIEKADQTIKWDQDLSSVVMYSQVALEATSSSNLPVSYEMSPNNVATLYSNAGKWYLDCYGSGAVSIRATQNGDKNHNASPIITKTLVVYGNGGDDPSNPQIYLNVEEPGTLSSMIAENRKYQIKNLRLTGNLNGTDINFIREMAGSDSFGNPTPGILETLDISGCTVVSGGRSYYQSNRTSEYVVGDYMFYNCKVLTTLRLPENSISIGNSAFADCDRLSVIAIPNSVKSFGPKSFANAISLLRIPMPDDLTIIGDMAFMGCNGITALTLPESVSSIGDGIVNGCQNLSQIDVEVGNSHYASKDGVLYDSGFHELLIFPVNHEKAEYSVVDEVTSIAPYAFLNAKKLTTVNLPSTLTSIGKDAFIGCMNLSTLQVKALNPPVCQNDCFENVSKTRCELQVPLGCRSYYWVAPVWSEFNRIVESDFTGIENVESNGVHISVQNGSINISGCPQNIVVRIYHTNGTLVFNSNATEGFLQFTPNSTGTYILLIGSTSYKILIK